MFHKQILIYIKETRMWTEQSQDTKKVQNTENLKFEKACSIVKTMEMADNNTQEFHPSSGETIQVNNLF